MSVQNGYDPALDPNRDKKLLYTWGGDNYVNAPTYTRNPQCWLQNVDMSCVCADLIYINTTLVSPRHLITCGHTTPYINLYNWSFVAKDGTKVLGFPETIYNWYPSYDISIITLRDPLPDIIKPAKILPSNWPDYFDEIAHPTNLGWPPYPDTLPALSGVYANQDRFVMPIDVIYLNEIYPQGIIKPSAIPKGKEYNQTLRPGDSGSPVLLFIGGETVYIGSLLPSLFFVTNFKTQLNNYMMAHGGYTLTEVDLTQITVPLPIEYIITPAVSKQVLRRPVSYE